MTANGHEGRRVQRGQRADENCQLKGNQAWTVFSIFILMKFGAKVPELSHNCSYFRAFIAVVIVVFTANI